MGSLTIPGCTWGDALALLAEAFSGEPDPAKLMLHADRIWADPEGWGFDDPCVLDMDPDAEVEPLRLAEAVMSCMASELYDAADSNHPGLRAIIYSAVGAWLKRLGTRLEEVARG